MTVHPKILALGEVLWDLFPEGAQFGGAPANFASHAAILGAQVALVSAVGKDKQGREAVAKLMSYGVDTTLVQRVEEQPTGTVGIELSASGKPTFTIHENSAWDCIAWNDDLEVGVRSADAIYFGTLGQRGEVSRSTIRRALALAGQLGIQRVLDVNLRRPFYDDRLIRHSVELTTILKLSDDELEEVCSACNVPYNNDIPTSIADLRQAMGLESVVLTLGPDGAMLATKQGIVHQPGVPTQVVDTVGAGDSFTAAFMVNSLRSASPEVALRSACELAAQVCSHSGAVRTHSI